MPYTKYTWQNLPLTTTPISKANLDHLETQYEEFTKLYDAHSILIAILDDTPVVLPIAASRIVGRKGTGNIIALTGAELMAILTGQAGAIFSFNGQVIDNIGVPVDAGDALRKGTRVTVTELPAMTDEKIWKGTGGNVEEIDVPTEFPDAAAGDYLETSADTERNSAAAAYEKVKEIKLGRDGTYRVKFDLKSSNATFDSHGRVYKNGAAFGTEQTNNTTSYVTKSEDIAGFAIGDLIQLYIKQDDAFGASWIENFRIYTNNPILNNVVTD